MNRGVFIVILTGYGFVDHGYCCGSGNIKLGMGFVLSWAWIKFSVGLDIKDKGPVVFRIFRIVIFTRTNFVNSEISSD